MVAIKRKRRAYRKDSSAKNLVKARAVKKAWNTTYVSRNASKLDQIAHFARTILRLSKK